MFALSLVLIAGVALLPACRRQASLPLDEGVRAIREVQDGNSAIIAVDGAPRKLTELNGIGVHHREYCSGPRDPDCWWIRAENFAPPVAVELSNERLVVRDERGQVEFLRKDVDHIVLREPAPERGAILVGVAVFAAALAGYAVFVGTEELRQTGHDLAPLYMMFGAAAAAGGASLLVTIPLTSDIGEEVQPKSSADDPPQLRGE